MIELENSWYELGIVNKKEINELIKRQIEIEDKDIGHLKYFLLERFINEKKLNSNNYIYFLYFLISEADISIILAILYKILYNFEFNIDIFNLSKDLILKLDPNSTNNIIKAELKRKSFYGISLTESEFLEHLKNVSLHYTLLEIINDEERLNLLLTKTESKKLDNIIKAKIQKVKKHMKGK